MQQSFFVFRLILGAIFIVEYFVGYDGHGRGAGNIITLALGAAFVGFGLYGLVKGNTAK